MTGRVGRQQPRAETERISAYWIVRAEPFGDSQGDAAPVPCRASALGQAVVGPCQQLMFVNQYFRSPLKEQ